MGIYPTIYEVSLVDTDSEPFQAKVHPSQLNDILRAILRNYLPHLLAAAVEICISHNKHIKVTDIHIPALQLGHHH